MDRIDVDAPDDAPGNGVCEVRVFWYERAGINYYTYGCTLRAAIEEANAHPLEPNTINFAARGASGADARTISLPNGAVNITAPLTINGASSGIRADRLVIAGSGSDRIFTINGPAVTITGVTLAHGRAPAGQPDGGAIYAKGAGPLTLENVWVRDNVAPRYGGGVYLENGSGHKVTRSTLSGNTAGFGGGIATRGAPLELVNSTISDNTANGGGTASNALGGGLYAQSVSDFNHVILQHVTITHNSAGSGRGGGVALENGPSQFRFSNTIIAANSAATDREYFRINGIDASDGYNLIGDDPGDAPPSLGVGSYAATDLRDQPANFGVLGMPDGASVPMRGVTAGSAAIDKGKNFGVLIDQRGGLRPIDNPNIPNASGGDGSDIGAYELGGMVVNNLGDAPDAAIDGVCATSGSVCTLRAAIQEINASPSGGVIYFNLPGSAPHTIDLTTALPNFERNTNIIGPGANQLTIRRAANAAAAFRIFTFTPLNGGFPSANVSGITIAYGLVNTDGAGGGGVFVGGNDTVTLDSVIVRDNAVSGTGVTGGGGIYNLGNLIVRNSTISGNTVSRPEYPGEGGGIKTSTPNGRLFQLINSTVSGNSSNGWGGGLYVLNGITNPSSGIFNSTIAFNTTASTGRGGGIYNESGQTGDTATRLRSTIVANNTSPDFFSQRTVVSDGYNLVQTRSSETGWSPTADLPAGTNPLLLPLADNGGPTKTHRLGANSPAIDKGVAAGFPTDQRGSLRPFDNPAIANASGGDGSDIGAVEIQQVGGIAFKVQPSTTIQDRVITPAVQVQIVDETGSPALVERAIALALGSNPEGATLSGTTAVQTVQGVATFDDLSVNKPGTGYTLVATADVGSAPSNAFTIEATPTRFEVSAPANATLGTPFNFTVTVRDGVGNRITSYRDTVAFTSNDGSATLPANYTFTTADAGQHTFSATINSPGTRTITVTDTAQSSRTGTSGNIAVPPPVSGTPDLLATSDSGTSQTDNLTNDATPTFSIAAVMNGATVDLLRDGGSTPVATGTASGTTIELTATSATDGAHTYTARQTVNGQTSAVSASLAITIDTAAPATSAPDLQAGSDSGASNSDNITSAVTRVFDIAGTENGAGVTLLRNGNVVVSGAGNGGSVTLTDNAAITDGTYNYTARQTDAAGNVSTSSALSVTFDTSAPATATPDLQAASDSGVSGTDNVTNATSLAFDITNTDNGSTVQLLRGGTVIASSAGNGGTLVLTDSSSPANGSHSYTVTQTDRAGNGSSSASALSVTVDRTAPTITALTSPHTSPTKNNPITNVSASFSEPVFGFTAADVTLTNATLTNFTGGDNSSSFNFDLTPGADGVVAAEIASGVATDRAGNATSNSRRFEITYDGTAPTVSITAVSPDPRNTSVGTITIVFSEAISGFDLTDLSLTRNGSAVALTDATLTSSDNRTWTLGNVSSRTTADGSYTLALSTPGIVDGAGNALANGATETWLMDATAPTVTISAPSQSLANPSSSVTFTVTYSDANFSASTLAAGNITLHKTGDASAQIAVSGSGTSRIVTLSNFTGNGTLAISVAAGTATDTAGNTAPAAGPSATFQVDTTRPSVTINQRSDQPDPATSEPVHFTAVFSEPVADFDGSDVSFSGTAASNASATVTQVAPNDGTTYNVAASGMTANGTLTASIAADKAHDAAGNGNTASSSTDATVLYFGVDLISAFEVNSLADTDDGVCAPADVANGCTLREAIAAANQEPGRETITFAVTGIINLTAPLPSITGDVTIDGPGAAQLMVRRGTSGAYRIFTVDAGANVQLSKLTISNGVVPEGSIGGGIFNAGTLTVANCVVSGNSAPAGRDGAGIATEGNLTVTGSTVSGNSAVPLSAFSGGSGGGISSYSETGSTVAVTIRDSIITGNSAGDGAGLRMMNGSLTIVNSTVSNNTATRQGGGIRAAAEPLTLVNSTISGNTAGDYGGGIDNIGELIASHCTISGNTVGPKFGGDRPLGAGLMNYSGAATLTNVTVTNNRALFEQYWAGGAGAGIFAYGDSAGPTLLLRNTIVSGNYTEDSKPGSGAAERRDDDLSTEAEDVVVPSSAHNLVKGGGSRLPQGQGNITDVYEPQFAALGNNGGSTQTHLLRPGSAAVNAGAPLASLGSALNASETTLQVTGSTAGIPGGVGFVVQLDSEHMIVTAVAPSTLTVTRGANGTSAAAHAVGAAINTPFDQRGAGFIRRYGNAPDIGADESQAGVAHSLGFTVQPSNSTALTAMSPAVKVQILDPAGALSSSTAEVALDLYDRPPNGGELSGTTSVAAVSGTATFSNLLITRPGAGYTLQASTTELPNARWIVSDAFTVSSAASLSGTKTVAGSFDVSGTVTYTIVLTNSGPASQINNQGREFTDVLPAGLTLVSVTATSGSPSTNIATRTAGWNGTLAKDASVTITITATINNDQAGQTITNQGSISYDADGDGTNEASAVTDDPTVAGNSNPTSFQVDNPPPPPTPTPSPSPTVSPTPSPSPNPTASPSPNPTVSPSPSASPSPIPSASPSPTASASPSPTASPSPSPTPSKALNISTRLRVETGDNVMIGGFIITGDETKRVIIRALGPSLRESGVDNAVADPMLELRGPAGELIFANDNWREAQERDIEDSTVPPPNDLESAIVATLAPGAYTAVVTGKGETSGVGLVEVYDLNQTSDSQLANISTRGLVLTDTNVLIGGFILGGGEDGTRVVIRALGPSLVAAGVANTLVDPTLDLRDANGEQVIFNDNWRDDSGQEAELNALSIAPQNEREAAIVTKLAPGSYTAIVSGKAGGIGVGLVEVYNVP